MAVELLKVHGLIKMTRSKILPNVCINITYYNQPFVILKDFQLIMVVLISIIFSYIDH